MRDLFLNTNNYSRNSLQRVETEICYIFGCSYHHSDQYLSEPGISVKIIIRRRALQFPTVVEMYCICTTKISIKIIYNFQVTDWTVKFNLSTVDSTLSLSVQGLMVWDSWHSGVCPFGLLYNDVVTQHTWKQNFESENLWDVFIHWRWDKLLSGEVLW